MPADSTDDFPSTDRRYSTVPLPDSRYLPGRTSRPAGSGAVKQKDRLRHGVDLYNNGYWWEAHEAWEEVWLGLAPNSAERHGVQAMIQTANAHLKIHLGQAGAARKLVREAEKLFDAALLHETDLAIEGFSIAGMRARVMAYFQEVLSMEQPRHDAQRFPRLAPERNDPAGA